MKQLLFLVVLMVWIRIYVCDVLTKYDANPRFEGVRGTPDILVFRQSGVVLYTCAKLCHDDKACVSFFYRNESLECNGCLVNLAGSIRRNNLTTEDGWKYYKTKDRYIPAKDAWEVGGTAGRDAILAIDGKRNNVFLAGGCAEAQYSVTIEFNQPATVEFVDIYLNYDKPLTATLSVRISETKEDQENRIFQLCSDVEGGENYEFLQMTVTCQQPVYGKVLGLYFSETGRALNLCEVEAYSVDYD